MNATMKVFSMINGRDDVALKSSSPYCKTYMFGNEGTNVAIVDPVLDEVDNYVALLAKEGLQLSKILETHTHADHISGAAALADRTGVEIVMHDRAPGTCVGSESRVKEGDELELAGVKIKVIHTPGHTLDSVSFVLPNRVFTGDSLFLDDGGAGRDDLPGGDPLQHWESIKKLMELDGNLVMYPAHDYRGKQPATLLSQHQSNPHVIKALEGKEIFLDYINELKLGPADWMRDVLLANYACALEPGDVWIPVDAASCEVKGTLDFGANAQEVESITPRQLQESMKSGREFLLLDVREPFELDEPLGKLDGVLNIPITQVTARLDDLRQYKDKEVAVICKIGGRSYTAGQILKQEGFSNVKYLEGGMIAWRNAYGSAN